MPVQCTVVTPEEQVFDGPVQQAILPAHDGLIGILVDRAPLLVKLGVGPLRLDLANGQKQSYFVDGGVAQMKDNRLTILSTEATPASEIDYESAKAEYAEAAARRTTDEKAAAARQHQMDRARAKQQMAAAK